MVVRNLILTFSAAHLLAGCTHERGPLIGWPGTKPRPQGDGKQIVCDHPQPVPQIYGINRVAYTNGVRVPDDVHAYAVGRMPRGQDGMDEAHTYYRIEQTAHWDLRLPRRRVPTTGPVAVYNAPTYVPPPHDQRVRDAVQSANDARDQAVKAQQEFTDAAQKLRNKANDDLQLRDELQRQLEINRQLQERLNQGFSTPSATEPTPTPQKSVDDALKAWQQQLDQSATPSATTSQSPTQP